MGKPRVRYFDIRVRIPGPLFLLMRCFAKSLYEVWSAYSQPFLWVVQRILLISEAVSLVFCFTFIQLYTFFVCVHSLFNTVVCEYTGTFTSLGVFFQVETLQSSFIYSLTQYTSHPVHYHQCISHVFKASPTPSTPPISLDVPFM